MGNRPVAISICPGTAGSVGRLARRRRIRLPVTSVALLGRGAAQPACPASRILARWALRCVEDPCRLYIIVEDRLPTVQVSAHISEETKARLERFARRTGQTRARLIEDALQQHLQALEELPADAIVPARIVLSEQSAGRVREMIARPPASTEEMKRLFDDR
jgi:predicted DNA-binding protein